MLAPRLCLGMGRAMNLNTIKRIAYASSVMLALLATPGLIAVDHFVSDGNQVHVKALLYFLLVAGSVVLIVVHEFSKQRIKRANFELESKLFKQNVQQIVVSQLVRLNERKTDLIKENTYSLHLHPRDFPYCYNVHQYLREICGSMESVVSEVISANINNIDVSLIYRYPDDVNDSDWKWIVGRSGLSGGAELKRFIEDPSTLYFSLINCRCDNPIFCNDKSASSFYAPGRRDRLFGCQGSYFAINLECRNASSVLLEAVLLLSTYGINFVPIDGDSVNVDSFKFTLQHVIIPPFVSLLQTEFAALYMRHNWDNVKRVNFGGLDYCVEES